MIKQTFLIAMAMVALMGSGAQQAYAFSSVTMGGTSSDGSPKFADPDEQRPAFMVTSTGGQSSGTSSGSYTGANLPTFGDITPGAQAFDQAYAHQHQ